MGRHSADAKPSTPEAGSDADVPSRTQRVLGPVTDPLLLDAVQEQLRRERAEGAEPETGAPHSLADLHRAWQPYRRPADGDATPAADTDVDTEQDRGPDAADDARRDEDDGDRPIGTAPALLDLAPPPRSAVRGVSTPSPEDSSPHAAADGPAEDPVGLSVPMAVIVVAVGVGAAIALSVLAVVPH